jgi:hypothetical protein
MRKGTDAPSDSAEQARPAGAGRPSRPETPQVPIPRTVDLAVLAVGALIVFTLLHLILARGFTDQLIHVLRHENAISKNPIKNFKGHEQLAHFRKGLLLQGLIASAALGLLGYSLRRTRAASGARWALLIIIVLLANTNGPLMVVPISGYPGAMQVARILIGISSIAVLVFMLLPKSMNYFRDCKIASRGEGAAPGLAGLFGPRSATARRGAASGAAAADRAKRPAAQSQPHTAEATNPARARSKAKVRADADAVAKGAELKRERQKASKSRKIDQV